MSEGGDGPFCRVCGKEFRYRRHRYVCCNGHDCGCYGAMLPDDVCSTACLEAEIEEDEEFDADEELGSADLEERLDAAFKRADARHQT